MMGIERELKDAAASLERCCTGTIRAASSCSCICSYSLAQLNVVRSTTILPLSIHLLLRARAVHRCNETAISLKASCQLFLRYTTRTNDLDEPIDASKARLIEVRRRPSRLHR